MTTQFKQVVRHLEEHLDLINNEFSPEENACIYFKSMMNHPDLDDNRKLFWLNIYLQIAQEKDYALVYEAVFDYLNIPDSLTLKEKISYYQLVGVVLDDDG